jgi:serine/threonine protein kinase
MGSPAITVHGRYQLGGKPVGQGGMGVVYKAYDIVTRRHVALKTMRGPLDAAALELFAKESWTSWTPGNSNRMASTGHFS